MKADPIVIVSPRGPRSLLLHVFWLIVIVGGALVTFDPRAPMHPLPFWLLSLLIWIPFAVSAFRRMHRSVVLDPAARQVVIDGRPLLFRRVTKRYDVGRLTGVRSFLHRSQPKAPYGNYLELVAPDDQRGLVVLVRGAGNGEAEHPEVARLRTLLANETWLRDLGYGHEGTRMPRQVMADHG